MRVQFVKKSSNSKIGPIPCSTTERASCPDECPFIGFNGCYAEAGYYTRLNWNKVSAGERGTDWTEFCQEIEKLPAGQLWRHNVAGDLPKDSNGLINAGKLAELVRANKGKRGFTYTHYADTPINISIIHSANIAGFTVNLSANNIDHALRLVGHGLPVASVVPIDHGPKTRVIDGVKFITCPATYREDITCADCKLCAVSDRGSVVCFPAHGAQSKSADIIARG